MATKQKRIFCFDFMKVVAMFMVVIYHFSLVLDFGQIGDDGLYIPNVNKLLLSFCSAGVPLFFMVNGALSFEKSRSIVYCMKKALRLLFVAIFWTFLFQFFIYPFFFSRPRPSCEVFISYYWFLIALAELYLVTIFLSSNKWLRISVVCMLLICPFGTNFLWDILLFFECSKTLPQWGHIGLFSMYSIVYYYLGALLRYRNLKWYHSFLFIILGFSLVNFETVVMTKYYGTIYDGVNSAFPTLGALFMAIGFFTWMKQAEVTNGFVRRLVFVGGAQTIGVYIFHFFAIMLIGEFLFEHKVMNIVIVISVSIFVFVLTAILSWAISNSPLKVLLRL